MREIGGVGSAARASGVDMDVRRDLDNIGVYGKLEWKSALKHSGDVIARAKIRRVEIRESVRIVRALLNLLEQNSDDFSNGEVTVGALKSNTLAVSAVEAWRGEAVVAAFTGSDGKVKKFKVVDPSFHNWFALALALRGEQISNFPICNKSFNLSYCGHDL